MPGSPYLAGSALTLDRAVANVVGWGLAELPEALRMASDTPRRLLAGVLDRRAIRLDPGTVEWSADAKVETVRLGPVMWAKPGR